MFTSSTRISNCLKSVAYGDTEKGKTNNVNIKPSFTFHGDVFKIKLGVNLVNSPEGFGFFPDLEASANIAIANASKSISIWTA